MYSIKSGCMKEGKSEIKVEVVTGCIHMSTSDSRIEDLLLDTDIATRLPVIHEGVPINAVLLSENQSSCILRDFFGLVECFLSISESLVFENKDASVKERVIILDVPSRIHYIGGKIKSEYKLSTLSMKQEFDAILMSLLHDIVTKGWSISIPKLDFTIPHSICLPQKHDTKLFTKEKTQQKENFFSKNVSIATMASIIVSLNAQLHQLLPSQINHKCLCHLSVKSLNSISAIKAFNSIFVSNNILPNNMLQLIITPFLNKIKKIRQEKNVKDNNTLPDKNLLSDTPFESYSIASVNANGQLPCFEKSFEEMFHENNSLEQAEERNAMVVLAAISELLGMALSHCFDFALQNFPCDWKFQSLSFLDRRSALLEFLSNEKVLRYSTKEEIKFSASTELDTNNSKSSSRKTIFVHTLHSVFLSEIFQEAISNYSHFQVSQVWFSLFVTIIVNLGFLISSKTVLKQIEELKSHYPKEVYQLFEEYEKRETLLRSDSLTVNMRSRVNVEKNISKELYTECKGSENWKLACKHKILNAMKALIIYYQFFGDQMLLKNREISKDLWRLLEGTFLILSYEKCMEKGNALNEKESLDKELLATLLYAIPIFSFTSCLQEDEYGIKNILSLLTQSTVSSGEASIPKMSGWYAVKAWIENVYEDSIGNRNTTNADEIRAKHKNWRICVSSFIKFLNTHCAPKWQAWNTLLSTRKLEKSVLLTGPKDICWSSIWSQNMKDNLESTCKKGNEIYDAMDSKYKNSSYLTLPLSLQTLFTNNSILLEKDELLESIQRYVSIYYWLEELTNLVLTDYKKLSLLRHNVERGIKKGNIKASMIDMYDKKIVSTSHQSNVFSLQPNLLDRTSNLSLSSCTQTARSSVEAITLDTPQENVMISFPLYNRQSSFKGPSIKCIKRDDSLCSNKNVTAFAASDLAEDAKGTLDYLITCIRELQMNESQKENRITHRSNSLRRMISSLVSKGSLSQFMTEWLKEVCFSLLSQILEEHLPDQFNCELLELSMFEDILSLSLSKYHAFSSYYLMEDSLGDFYEKLSLYLTQPLLALDDINGMLTMADAVQSSTGYSLQRSDKSIVAESLLGRYKNRNKILQFFNISQAKFFLSIFQSILTYGSFKYVKGLSKHFSSFESIFYYIFSDFNFALKIEELSRMSNTGVSSLISVQSVSFLLLRLSNDYTPKPQAFFGNESAMMSTIRSSGRKQIFNFERSFRNNELSSKAFDKLQEEASIKAKEYKKNTYPVVINNAEGQIEAQNELFTVEQNSYLDPDPLFSPHLQIFHYSNNSYSEQEILLHTGLHMQNEESLNTFCCIGIAAGIEKHEHCAWMSAVSEKKIYHPNNFLNSLLKESFQTTESIQEALSIITNEELYRKICTEKDLDDSQIESQHYTEEAVSNTYLIGLFNCNKQINELNEFILNFRTSLSKSKKLEVEVMADIAEESNKNHTPQPLEVFARVSSTSGGDIKNNVESTHIASLVSADDVGSPKFSLFRSRIKELVLDVLNSPETLEPEPWLRNDELYEDLCEDVASDALEDVLMMQVEESNSSFSLLDPPTVNNASHSSELSPRKHLSFSSSGSLSSSQSPRNSSKSNSQDSSSSSALTYTSKTSAKSSFVPLLKLQGLTPTVYESSAPNDVDESVTSKLGLQELSIHSFSDSGSESSYLSYLQKPSIEESPKELSPNTNEFILQVQGDSELDPVMATGFLGRNNTRTYSMFAASHSIASYRSKLSNILKDVSKEMLGDGTKENVDFESSLASFAKSNFLNSANNSPVHAGTAARSNQLWIENLDVKNDISSESSVSSYSSLYNGNYQAGDEDDLANSFHSSPRFFEGFEHPQSITSPHLEISIPVERARSYSFSVSSYNYNSNYNMGEQHGKGHTNGSRGIDRDSPRISSPFSFNCINSFDQLLDSEDINNQSLTYGEAQRYNRAQEQRFQGIQEQTPIMDLSFADEEFYTGFFINSLKSAPSQNGSIHSRNYCPYETNVDPFAGFCILHSREEEDYEYLAKWSQDNANALVRSNYDFPMKKWEVIDLGVQDHSSQASSYNLFNLPCEKISDIYKNPQGQSMERSAGEINQDYVNRMMNVNGQSEAHTFSVRSCDAVINFEIMTQRNIETHLLIAEEDEASFAISSVSYYGRDENKHEQIDNEESGSIQSYISSDRSLRLISEEVDDLFDEGDEASMLFSSGLLLKADLTEKSLENQLEYKDKKITHSYDYNLRPNDLNYLHKELFSTSVSLKPIAASYPKQNDLGKGNHSSDVLTPNSIKSPKSGIDDFLITYIMSIKKYTGRILDCNATLHASYILTILMLMNFRNLDGIFYQKGPNRMYDNSSLWISLYHHVSTPEYAAVVKMVNKGLNAVENPEFRHCLTLISHFLFPMYNLHNQPYMQGTTINQLEKIGSGSFGTILRIPKQDYVLKMIVFSPFDRKYLGGVNLTRELFALDLLQNISSPTGGICELVDSGVTIHGNCGIVMKEYKSNLKQWREKTLEKLPLLHAVYLIMYQIVDVVEQIHLNNIIHLDIKADNIFIDTSTFISIVLPSSSLNVEASSFERSQEYTPDKDSLFKFEQRAIEACNARQTFKHTTKLPEELYAFEAVLGALENDCITLTAVDKNKKFLCLTVPSIRLGDFGESQYVADAENPYYNGVAGTECIRDPIMFQVKNENNKLSRGVSFSADIWSLGCLFYELITGQFLFSMYDIPMLLADNDDVSIIHPDKINNLRTVLERISTDFSNNAKSVLKNELSQERTSVDEIIELLLQILRKSPSDRSNLKQIKHTLINMLYS